MVCRGSDAQPADPVRWPLRSSLNILGHIVQNDGGIRVDWNSTKKALWRCFWKNCGSKACARIGAEGKAKLLQRSVVTNFLWKVSRWPFQKTIAIELDKVQCKMIAIIVPCPRAVEETLDHYCRRRLRQARNVSQHLGFWSSLWSQRVLNWEEHLQRGQRYAHICTRLLKLNSDTWLQQQRSVFVASNSASTRNDRNSLFSGRTGTRLNIGRPQVRWQDGCTIARTTKEARAISSRGQNARTIGTIIKEAFDHARAFVNRGNRVVLDPRHQ